MCYSSPEYIILIKNYSAANAKNKRDNNNTNNGVHGNNVKDIKDGKDRNMLIINRRTAKIVTLFILYCRCVKIILIRTNI